MINGKKVIGFCITKIQDRTRTEIVDTIYDTAKAEGFKLIVFNSLVDFYNNDSYDEGASAIYDLINFDVLDALIVHYESFYSKKSIDAVIERALEKKIPVILLKGQKEGCYNLVCSCENAYKKLIKHVIVDHNISKIMFMSGRRDDQYSQERLAIYKATLLECGIEYTDDMLLFGDYNYEPARKIVNKLIDDDNLPEALICANDNMAIAACEAIAERGMSVPGDCIVTGFDGTFLGGIFNPRLTTCVEDTGLMARQSIEVLKEALTGQASPKTYEVYNTFRMAASCGCVMDNPKVDRDMLVKAYKHIESMEANEYETFRWNTRISEVTDVNLFFSFIARMIHQNSHVCVNKDLLTYGNKQATEGMYYLSEEVVLIPSDEGIDYKENKENEMVKLSDIVYKPELWAEDDSMYVITMINAGKEPCGFFATKTNAFYKDAHIYNRASETINNAFNALLIRLRDINTQRNDGEALFVDPLTKLPNIKGATRWFEEFKLNDANREKLLAVSVYALPKYKYLYENYGINELELGIRFVAEALKDSNDTECFIAHITEDEFVIVNTAADDKGVGRIIDYTTKHFFESMTYYNNNKADSYFVEVNCGCHVADPGWNDSLENYIKLANNAMYINRLTYKNANDFGKDDTFKVDHVAYNNLVYLIEKNLFRYHFQPVVSAKTGEIFGYEALMRSGGGVSMNPLEILQTAGEYGKLYDIEKLTLFNIMETVVNNMAVFRGKKVFINTIPGHFLSTIDRKELIEKYEEYLDNFVFEITEQDSVSSEEVNAIKSISSDGQSGIIAVDDYGTGHSNIVNLFRYSPHVIKVDRFLISNIDTDTNKQMFVKNTVEFAAQNNIKVLAEGVETSGELRTAIDCGVDFIQGFYTGRPTLTPITDIEDSIHDEIIAESIKLAKIDNNLHTYVAKSGEIVNVVDLAARLITSIVIPEGKVLLVGDANNTVNLSIVIEENSEVELTISNINIKASQVPSINVGKGSSLELTLDGDNTLNREGIYVHPTASLDVKGEGNLTINNNRNHSAGIGSNYDEPFGSLSFNGRGVIRINASGENVVGIGGGDCAGDGIRLDSGNFIISGRGIHVVGVGCGEGMAAIKIGKRPTLTINCNGNESVALGTISGKATILSKGDISVTSDGEKSVGIGSSSGKCDIVLEEGKISSIVHCDAGTCIGNISGETTLVNKTDAIRVYGEGTTVCGIGSLQGKCFTTYEKGEVFIDLLSATMVPLGRDTTVNDLAGGRIRLSREAKINVNHLGGEIIIG